MEDLNHLFGTCACERNQYTVVIPTSSSSLAQVFFDNSVANRRAQASPVTAWLRVPLDWYHSSTFAQFPDETHATIKRTFDTAPSYPGLPPTRRQFCGYCGTHLTAWNESAGRGEHVDVTLGSLLNESLDRLEQLQLYSDIESESEEGAQIDDDAHIATNEQSVGGVDDSASAPATQQRRVAPPLHQMQGRGMPYFEEMVENSRLGRIKRRKGGRTSANGTRSVEWEVVEISGGDEDEDVGGTSGVTVIGEDSSGNKRQRLDV